LGGKINGNINADQIRILKTANIDGVLNQKILSIEEGATLKIKTQTYK
jgi:cytoskeletal protein CcmA (bactofilin family)